MPGIFESARYDLIKGERVHITNYRFGRNRQGALDVWIESNDRGERFLSQITSQDVSYAVRYEIYTKKCYILREKTTGQYGFLDQNDCGFWLHSKTFSGAETYFGAEAAKIQTWLTECAA